MKPQPLIFLPLFLLMGCEFGTKENSTEAIVDQPKSTFVEYQIEAIKEKKGPCSNESTGEKCLNIDIQYPIIESGAKEEVIDSINHSIQKNILTYAFISEPKDDFPLLIEEMSEEYSQILEENPDYEAGWLLEISSDIIYQDSTFISTATTIFSYTGGAHPNSYQVYRSYDLATGKVLKLEDVLVEDYADQLNSVGEIEFRMDKQIPPDQSLEEEGYFFEEGKFKLNDNFAIMNKSMLFYFNPYEIGPNAMGATELELKLTDYAALIKPTGLLGKLKN